MIVEIPDGEVAAVVGVLRRGKLGEQFVHQIFLLGREIGPIVTPCVCTVAAMVASWTGHVRGDIR